MGAEAGAKLDVPENRQKRGEDMKLRKELKAFFLEEQGVGVIELVLVLVVLIGLVIIFKKQITMLLNSIFKEINSQSKEVY